MNKLNTLIILCIIIATFQICNSRRILKSFDELRLHNIKRPSVKSVLIVENVFSNLTREYNTAYNSLIKSNKLTSYEFKNKASPWNGATKNTFLMDKLSKTARKAYRELLYLEDDLYLNLNLDSQKIPSDFCKEPIIKCGSNNHYRSINGSCNNLKSTWYGMAESPFKRLLRADYEDGVNSPRKKSVTGALLPNPREVTLVLSPARDTESIWSQFFIFFGQHVVHDLTLTGSVVSVYGTDKVCKCNQYDPDCVNIPTPSIDKLNLYDQKCMTVVRSSSTFKDLNCHLGAREQVNLNTHWLDLSTLYGSSEKLSRKLRTYEYGLLKTSNSKYSNLHELPRREGSKCPAKNRAVKCFLGGDPRAEDNAIGLSINALLLREHNRIAYELAELNPNWDDEMLFQESRRLLIAKYQHIVYNEYLPELVGSEITRDFGLNSLNDGYEMGYDSELYPQIINEVATAALRVGHTLVADDNYRADNLFNLYGKEDITFYQFNSNLALLAPLEHVHYGSLNHSSYIPSPQINDGLNNYLHEGIFSNDQTVRWSLGAINTQRGREHGLQGYNYYRRLCGLNYAKTFDDFENIPKKHLDRLRYVYAHPDDVDLFSGIISESPLKDSVVGQTAACLISKQFSDLKYGDRFFYENGHDDNTKFTRDQLKQIRKSTMARIICDNTNVEFVARYPFLIYDKDTNPWINCNDLPVVSLAAWKDLIKH